MSALVFAELSIRCEEIRLKAVQAVADHSREIGREIEKQLENLDPRRIEAMVREQVDRALDDAVRDEVRRQVVRAIQAWLSKNPPVLPSVVERAVRESLERLR